MRTTYRINRIKQDFFAGDSVNGKFVLFFCAKTCRTGPENDKISKTELKYVYFPRDMAVL